MWLCCSNIRSNINCELENTPGEIHPGYKYAKCHFYLNAHLYKSEIKFTFMDILAVFQIALFFFLLVVRTAATLTKYVPLHTVWIQLGHTTGDVTDQHTCSATPQLPRLSRCDLSPAEQTIVWLNRPKSILPCMLRNATRCCTTAWYFRILLFPYYLLGHNKYFSGALNSMVLWVLEYRESGIHELEREGIRGRVTISLSLSLKLTKSEQCNK